MPLESRYSGFPNSFHMYQLPSHSSFPENSNQLVLIKYEKLPPARACPTYPNPIRSQLQVSQILQPFQALDSLYAILYKIQICQFLQMRDILDMLDFIEAQIQTLQVRKVLEAPDV